MASFHFKYETTPSGVKYSHVDDFPTLPVRCTDGVRAKVVGYIVECPLCERGFACCRLNHKLCSDCRDAPPPIVIQDTVGDDPVTK